MNDAAHISVMPAEVLEFLNLPAGGVAVDGTLGMAGHALLMAAKLGPQGHVIGIDRDKFSLASAKKRLSSLSLRVDLLQGNFKDINRLLAEVKVESVDGILLDLGISSFQLDDPARGFAFKTDSPLDMRMDQSSGLSAADMVNTASEEELARIIFEYGEDRFSRRIAKLIVQRRAEERIATTTQLADLVLRALPKGYQRGRIHPATRTFQALRIAVNGELDHLGQALIDCFNALKPGGRLCVISFHSLEDRIAKNTFKYLAQEGNATVLTKRPLEPSDEEQASNPRSRSAKLRAITRNP